MAKKSSGKKSYTTALTHTYMMGQLPSNQDSGPKMGGGYQTPPLGNRPIYNEEVFRQEFLPSQWYGSRQDRRHTYGR
ncbi:hypothetical protein GOV11_03610 [Candidatus Woesearchaeota archaeon]|nr:hypothetical protein [Candidatus Woesearchaeota archaeon]